MRNQYVFCLPETTFYALFTTRGLSGPVVSDSPLFSYFNCYLRCWIIVYARLWTPGSEATALLSSYNQNVFSLLSEQQFFKSQPSTCDLLSSNRLVATVPNTFKSYACHRWPYRLKRCQRTSRHNASARLQAKGLLTEVIFSFGLQEWSKVYLPKKWNSILNQPFQSLHPAGSSFGPRPQNSH